MECTQVKFLLYAKDLPEMIAWATALAFALLLVALVAKCLCIIIGAKNDTRWFDN